MYSSGRRILRPAEGIYGIFADNIPNRHAAQEGEQEEPDSAYERGADVTIDAASLSIKTADAWQVSACINTVGIKKNTLMKIINGADVALSAGSAASLSAGISARSQGGAVWMLVEESNLTSRSLSAANGIDAPAIKFWNHGRGKHRFRNASYQDSQIEN